MEQFFAGTAQKHENQFYAGEPSHACSPRLRDARFFEESNALNQNEHMIRFGHACDRA
jgi:hypothetical protein